ncbi:hypothetical protein [Notoacmeibacter sp. MSK16QG-6]|uniref:hypothetical protein n=1 Tax=Notoacmeibacter sp. MSK16QG-6 TaxID=2957982 RepID=UPI0020A105AE|nr:hypothetical protein [Notoacmeibacter sp. MSK16QG-6]MCP1198018.1 hypothetical protein [Notoacmeibacter sp. MSK16QG-6]
MARLQKFILLGATALSIAVGTAPSQATSGPGCLYVVNVAPYDVLNMRARPSARSAIVDQLPPRRHGIIHLDAKCRPLSRPWASRWCPVTHYEADRVISGWIKARYIRDIDCP